MEKQTILDSMNELLAIANRGIAGEVDALHDGWGPDEHEAYARAMRDAISIVESGE